MKRSHTLTAVLLSICLATAGYILGSMAQETINATMERRTTTALEMMK